MKKLAQRIYLSPLGFIISVAMAAFAFFHKPFMVYGFFSRKENKFYKKTRISSSAKLVDKSNILIKDMVWIGHYCLLDGIGGIDIQEGVNIASHTCIYTHSSQNSIRLLGKKFIEIPTLERAGYITGKVSIGEYTFVGTSCVILPGTSIGKGCIIGAGSVVKGDFPDFSVIVGNPARLAGDTRDIDKKLHEDGLDFKNYFDQALLSSNYFK
jgi:acetyltransferase-like isoleucine patch superfamily enzyme